jgi:choline dehydrogenase-like flavoprotein
VWVTVASARRGRGGPVASARRGRGGGCGKHFVGVGKTAVLPRERDNWDSTAVFVQGKYRHRSSGMTPTATSSRLGDVGMHPHHLLHHSIYMHKGMPIGATAHQAGTVRFGTDPASSALAMNCKAHELDNLYALDTSFFPGIGAVNRP